MFDSVTGELDILVWLECVCKV